MRERIAPSRRVPAGRPLLLVAGLLSGPTLPRPNTAQPLPGMEWAGFQVGQALEVDVVCSGTWRPVTLIRRLVPDPDYGPRYGRYTVRREDGTEWSFGAPGRVAPCGRPAGGIARERAALPAPQLGVYNCNYRGQVVPVFDFALLTPSTYRDYDGARGTYRLDGATRQLVFLTGPKRGAKAQQESAQTFQFVGDDGLGTGNYCPRNPSRDPNAPRL